MKKFILGFILLTASLGAHASMECSIKSIKQTIFGNLKAKTVGSFKVEDNFSGYFSGFNIGKYSIADSYKYAYWLNAQIECPADGQCKVEGYIYESFFRVLSDGTEVYVNHELRGKLVKVLKGQYQDLDLESIFSGDNKISNFRIECI